MTVGKHTVSEDRSGRSWAENSDTPGVHYLVDLTELKQGADLKRAFIVRRHVEAFVKYYGRSNTVFFTITDRDGITPKEFARRWHSLITHESEWIAAYMRVLEPQKQGRPHFHNLTAVNFDVKPDAFNWDAFAAAQQAYHSRDFVAFKKHRAIYVSSAVPELRALWAWGRRVMPLYGLGRCEILPVRKEGAISEYIGKYLDKGMAVKVDAWKGVRRFETDRRASALWKRCGSKFSWVSPGAMAWRARVAELAAALGCDLEAADLREIRKKLGPRWAYRMRGAILTADEAEWKHLCDVIANRDGKQPTVEYDNGENAAW